MIQPQHLQAQYPQAASAVSINIYEPKSYGSAPQQVPYQYSNELYAMPQGSAWDAQPTGVQSPYQQYMPQAVPPVAPAPVQQMPASAIEAPAVEPQVAPQTEQTATPMPEVQQGQEVQKVDTDALIKDLASTDFNTQAEAITSIANFTQATPDIALQVATDPVKQSLIDIIKSDTSVLESSTPEQTAIAEKQAKGETLTPEEQATLDKLSPKVAADKNKIFALFTLAMIQKLSRDNEAQYGDFKAADGQQPAQPTALKDLMGYNEIVSTIQNEPNKELKIAAIQALQYIAKPEEKAEVEAVLQGPLSDADEMVKQAAQDAIAKLGEAAPAEAPVADANAQTAPADTEQKPAEQAK